MVNPKKTHLYELGDNLSRPELKLWTKRVDTKNLRGKGEKVHERTK